MKEIFFINKIFQKEAIRFLLVGFINTIFGYSVYSIFIYINAPYSAALLMATIIGIVFNYFTFGGLVFLKKNNSVLFLKFLLNYIAIYFLNLSLLKMLSNFSTYGAYIDQIFCLMPIILLNWFSMKFFVFKSPIKSL